MKLNLLLVLIAPVISQKRKSPKNTLPPAIPNGPVTAPTVLPSETTDLPSPAEPGAVNPAVIILEPNTETSPESVPQIPTVDKQQLPIQTSINENLDQSQQSQPQPASAGPIVAMVAGFVIVIGGVGMTMFYAIKRREIFGTLPIQFIKT